MDEPSETATEAVTPLGLRRGTRERLRRQGAGPPFKRHGGRIFYPRAERAAWSKNSRLSAIRGLTVRLRPIAGMLVLLACLLALYLWKRPLLIWNASPSVPIGLYRVVKGPPRRGDLTIARLPERVVLLAERRGYIAASTYLLKPVAAAAGERVCRFGSRIFVRRRFAALAVTKDRYARMMPAWEGCRTLAAGELFLLGDHPESFDSRYFGPVNVGQGAGIAVLVWPARAI